MAQDVAWASGKSGIEDALLAMDADTAAYSGQLRKAEGLTKQAVESAVRADEKETAASYEAQAGLRQALFGNMAAAKQHANAALAMTDGRDVQYLGGLTLAMAGDSSRVQSLISDFAKRFPSDTLAKSLYVPTLRAELALQRHDFSKALSELDPIGPYEMGQASSSNTVSIALDPVYIHATVLLLAKRGPQATTELQKILEHRGVVINGPIGVMVHLALGRAYTLFGDTGKAKVAYQDFLAQWKDADPDIPVLKEAKGEYAALH
jgi:hypothetical protein